MNVFEIYNFFTRWCMTLDRSRVAIANKYVWLKKKIDTHWALKLFWFLHGIAWNSRVWQMPSEFHILQSLQSMAICFALNSFDVAWKSVWVVNSRRKSFESILVNELWLFDMMNRTLFFICSTVYWLFHPSYFVEICNSFFLFSQVSHIPWLVIGKVSLIIKSRKIMLSHFEWIFSFKENQFRALFLHLPQFNDKLRCINFPFFHRSSSSKL